MAPLLLLFSLLFLSLSLQLHGHFDPTRASQLLWQPRTFLYKGFLSHEECDHLISLAADKLEKSTVADKHTGERMMSEVRTSFGMFLKRHQDEIVERIERRIAAWTFLPEENGEAIQVLRYQTGQKYEPHYDFFFDRRNQKRGGHRTATVLMYLSEVAEGGETVFPIAEGSGHQLKNESMSDCAREGFAVKPAKGDALLFFSLHLNASTDMNSAHGSCPVIDGEKWSATKWIHVRSLNSLYIDGSSGECYDEDVLCSTWAAGGECQKNPLYMVGTRNVPGSCRKSCGLCVS